MFWDTKVTTSCVNKSKFDNGCQVDNSSKCILQNVYFINVHEKYINVYKMYRSQSTLRQLMYYTKSVQKCVPFGINFSSKCILQNVYFINVHKVYNVMHTSMF